VRTEIQKNRPHNPPSPINAILVEIAQLSQPILVGVHLRGMENPFLMAKIKQQSTHRED
jgi:hypothetical protein